MDFLRQLYTDLTCDNWGYMLTFLLGAFFIGWATRYFASRIRIRNAEEALERSKLELKQSKKLREGLQEKYDLKEADYQKASLSLIDKTKLLNTVEADKKRLNTKLQGTLDESAKAQSESKQTAARLEEMNDQILGLRTKNSQLNAELQQHTTTINQYANTQVDNTRLKELETVILQLRKENTSLKSETEAAAVSTSKYETLEQKVAQLEAEKEQWSDSISEITQLEGGNEALNASILQLMQENEGLQDQVDALSQYESGNDILNATILQLMEENEVLKANTSNTVIRAIPVEVEPTPEAASATSEVKEVELSTDEAKALIRTMIGSNIKFATPAEKDDLKKIQGIGPFIEEKLNDLGVYTFEQVSQLDGNMIPTLTSAIEFFPGRIERDEWVNQADRLFFMKNNSSTPSRRVISRTVVTRPSEERFVSEKKAIQEKIIVDPKPASKQKITRVVRREPIKRVERIVRRVPLKKDELAAKTEEKVDIPIPPKTDAVSLPKEEVKATLSRSVPPQPAVEPVITPTPQEDIGAIIPTPAASPGLKEYVSRKIVIPPVPVTEEVETPTSSAIVPEEIIEATNDAAVEELFEEEEVEITTSVEPVEDIEETEETVETTEEEIEKTTVEQTVEEEMTLAIEPDIAEKEVSIASVTAPNTDIVEEVLEGESISETVKNTPAIAAESAVVEDLKVIEGIGPKISELLNGAGIFNYAQLASKSVEELQDIIDEGGPRFRIARPKTWSEQAALAAAGKWEELKELQNEVYN